MGDTTAKGKSRTEARLDAAKRAQQALELRAARVSWQVIADRCGYGSKGAAHNAVQRVLRSLPREAAKELREVELESLDSLERGLTAAALRGNLGAVDRVLRIKDLRAKYTGLYEAPADSGVDEVKEALRKWRASLVDHMTPLDEVAAELGVDLSEADE